MTLVRDAARLFAVFAVSGAAVLGFAMLSHTGGVRLFEVGCVAIAACALHGVAAAQRA